MRMKRAWVIGFLALTAALCGCGKRQEEPENTLLYEDEIEDSDDYIVVGFAQVGSESDWRLANTQSFRDTFREDKGYYLLFEDGQQKQENQIKALRSFISQRVGHPEFYSPGGGLYYPGPHCGDWLGCGAAGSKSSRNSGDPLGPSGGGGG